MVGSSTGNQRPVTHMPTILAMLSDLGSFLVVESQQIAVPSSSDNRPTYIQQATFWTSRP
jgi:hypothetical protein